MENDMSNETANLKWYVFNQNNSGGHFVVNDSVSEFVFIQACNARHAITLAKDFLDNSDSCECCGDRWSFWVEDGHGTEQPTIYGKPYTEHFSGWVEDFARLHYIDGRVEAYPAATKD
jgi:hypothetical protein